MYVAIVAEVVVGYGRAQHLTDDAMAATPRLPAGIYLAGVNVEPGSRRRGIATALCNERVTWAHRLEKECWFFTNVNNEASRALHGAVGFIEVREFRSADLDGGVGVLGVHSVG
jgi:ribosomal protein S18 acetylase RimI-like enzyme